MEAPKNSNFLVKREKQKTMNFGVRAKLFTSFGTLLTLIAGVGFVGWQNTKELAADAESLYKNQLIGSVILSNFDSDLWKLRYGFPQYLIQPEKRQAIRTEEPELYKRINQYMANYQNIELIPEEKKGLEKLEMSYNRYIAARPQWFNLVDTGKLKEAAEYRTATTTPFGAETVELLQAQINLKQKIGENKHQQMLEKLNRLTILLSVTLVLALIIAGILSVVLGRNISQVILQSVKNITATSDKIAATVEQQQSTILQQANSVDKTTSTIEELGVFTLQSADKAENAAGGAQQALNLAQGGTQTVGRTVEGISELKDQVVAIANQIVQLSKQTAQISTVSGLVADLANQTNILALNAGVEAARAGDQGLLNRLMP
jgi:methyl-accepting chemotaxis protein